MAGLVDVAYDTLHRTLTLTSFLLERCLSHVYSSLRTSVTSFGKTNDQATATDRAWWDTSKGSAVVVWAPGDQTISQALALSLASIHARPGSKRAGRPPYTVIVIVPSASHGLASLISSWATRKANVEGGKYAVRGRKQVASWDFFGLGRLSLRVGSPESHTGEGSRAEETNASDEALDTDQQTPTSGEGRHSSSSPSTTPGKRRRLSFGYWSAPDVVGYGMDMLKGLSIGEDRSQGIGAVIPVVADTSTPEGISHAHSTIRAYCTSHDLLLRALVAVPSILSNTFALSSPNSPPELAPRPYTRSPRLPSSSRSHEVTEALEIDEMVYQSQAGGTSSLSAKSLQTTSSALASDVGQTMNVVASLVPALRSDGGRVIAIVPSAFRDIERKQDPWERYVSLVEIDDDDSLEFGVTRRAMLEMWSKMRSRLAGEGVQLSQIHMSAPRKQRVPRSFKQRYNPRSSREPPTSLRKLARHLLSKAHYILYPIPLPAKPRKPYVDSAGYYIVPTLREHNDSTDACPTLLLDAVRSVLVRSWPRPHYCVGLGPRLEAVWECIPGHDGLRTWILDCLSL